MMGDLWSRRWCASFAFMVCGVSSFALVAPGCTFSEIAPGDTESSVSASWQAEQEELSGAALSVWGDSDNVYVVGAKTDDGGPLMLHQPQRGEWDRVNLEVSGSLWWVAPDHQGEVWTVGESGLLLHAPIGTQSFVDTSLDLPHTFFGIWFSEDGTGWIVGSDITEPVGSAARGILLRSDSVAHAKDREWVNITEELPGEVKGAALYKVWGRSSEERWVVGESGVVLEGTGDKWEQLSTATKARLLTVRGSNEYGPFAVGGAGSGVLVDATNEAPALLSDSLGDGVPGLNGVFVFEDGRVVVAGNHGYVAQRAAGNEQWELEAEIETYAGFHAVFGLETGETWAVGGNLLSPKLDGGVVFSLNVPTDSD